MIDGISLDTSIFDRFGCNLNFPLLQKLDQFKGSEIDVVFSEIVISEVRSHIKRNADETLGDLKRTLKKHERRWHKKLDVDAILKTATEDLTPEDFATAEIDQYLNSVGGRVLPCTGEFDVTAEVLERYFGSQTPFEKKQAKKSEFPDAFALMSLEKDAAKRGKLLLCVSGDKGWIDYAEGSDHLVCVADLDVALSHFNATGQHVAEKLLAMFVALEAPDFLYDIELTIQADLDDLDFDAECHNGLEYEVEPTEAVLQNIDKNTLSNPIIIQADEEQVTFTFTVDALVNFGVSFDWYAYDSMDNDHVNLGYESAEIEKTISRKLIYTVDRKFEPEPYILESAVTKERLNIDFGYVDPFPNEDPTHEKY